MIRLLLLRFWPVLIPLIIYWVWLKKVGRKATIDGKPVLRFSDGPWFWAVLMSLLIAVICFVLLGAQSVEGGKGDYIPPHLENGAVVPGHVSDKP